jgi:hypothetical protein
MPRPWEEDRREGFRHGGCCRPRHRSVGIPPGGDERFHPQVHN